MIRSFFFAAVAVASAAISIATACFSLARLASAPSAAPESMPAWSFTTTTGVWLEETRGFQIAGARAIVDGGVSLRCYPSGWSWVDEEGILYRCVDERPVAVSR